MVCWAGLGWTVEQQASLSFANGDSLTLGPHSVDPGDAVWIRRPELPLPNPKTAEPDKKFAALEYRSLYHSVAYMLENFPVFCINKYSASRRIIQKSVQLHLARKCGLKIPATLMSNSPAAVRSILRPRWPDHLQRVHAARVAEGRPAHGGDYRDL